MFFRIEGALPRQLNVTVKLKIRLDIGSEESVLIDQALVFIQWNLVALWFILRYLFLVLPCVIFLCVCFSVLLALRLPRLGKRELILVLFVRLFGLRLFGFVCFLFLLVSGKGYGF